MKALLYIVVLIAFVSVVFVAYERTHEEPSQPTEEAVMCTADALICPDGTTVGRSGPNCEFVCPTPEVPVDPHSPAAKADLIRLTSPQPESVIASPLTISGVARGYWFFEASFPVVLTDWDGLIIAEGVATAEGDWMTEEFVPFTATLTYTKPSFGDRGSLILKKDNPSGLPENDDALEITVWFNEPESEVQ